MTFFVKNQFATSSYSDRIKLFPEKNNYSDNKYNVYNPSVLPRFLQAAKVADEVVTAVNTVKEKVEKLRSAKEIKDRVGH